MIIDIIQRLAMQYANALRSKPIQRVGRRKGVPYSFQSPAIATGRLADSVRVETTPDGYAITALSYVHFIEYGRKPGTFPPVTAIESWMKTKGISGSSYAIGKSMADYGSTIWQRYQGNNSGVFDDVDTDKAVEEIAKEIENSMYKDLLAVV